MLVGVGLTVGVAVGVGFVIGMAVGCTVAPGVLFAVTFGNDTGDKGIVGSTGVILICCGSPGKVSPLPAVKRMETVCGSTPG